MCKKLEEGTGASRVLVYLREHFTKAAQIDNHRKTGSTLLEIRKMANETSRVF